MCARHLPLTGMLAITETAAEAIKSLVSASEMPEGAGLRIAGDAAGEPGTLGLRVAPGPEEQDTVIDGDGAMLFLEPVAAQVLDDKILDAQTVNEDGQQQVQFAIGQQA